MAAPAGVFDQNLEEKIYQLQKLSVDSGTRQILEEAMQLCSDGHHMEAAALVEKAEAMSLLISHQEVGPQEVPSPERSMAGQALAARLAADIANGLTNILARAIHDLERHISLESGRLNSAFGERLDRLQSGVESLQPLHERLDHLVLAGAAVQEKYEQLAATTASLQEAHARLDTDMGAVRLQLDELSASTSNRVDEACRRIEGQEREISTINSGISELASKVAVAAERLERHANAIRTIHESHQERAAVLGQVGELLDRLRSPQASPDMIALDSL
jgi:predicted  nucleic acid-binding Zn-ribbon protein